MKGQDIANAVLPGLGHVVAFFIVLGGLAFNIGNVAGGGLGFNALTGISTTIGSIITAIICIIIFIVKEAGTAMDRIVRVLVALMIFLTAYVMLVSSPPYIEALLRTAAPAEIDIMTIITVVGGTVGGYITFAGGHRMLDAGIAGKENLRHVTNTSITGIIVASIMRVLLFLAVLGVVSGDVTLNPDNPTATVFLTAAGELVFGCLGLSFGRQVLLQ